MAATIDLDIVVGGVQKAGTTSLYHYFSAMPNCARGSQDLHFSTMRR